MTLLATYISLAIAVSFVCSVLEAVLLSVTPAYVGALRDTNRKAADRLERLKQDVDRPLAAILSLNTVAHTIGAAGAGAQAAAVFGSAYLGLFSAILTLAILIFSEIIPKTLGAVFWRELAPPSAAVLGPMITLVLPLVWLCQSVTKVISPRGQKNGVSRDELAAMADLGARQGVVELQEARILKNLLRFKELRAEDVMTPRTVVSAFPEEATVAEVAESGIAFSRLPIYSGNRDHVTGYVLRDEVFERLTEGDRDVALTDLRRDILTVNLDLPLPELFDRLLGGRQHLAVVVDEYGGTDGIVTMEDVIETLLGLEIVDEADETVDMRQLARQRWRERAASSGLLTKDELDEADIRASKIRYGITGGEPPVE